MKEDFEKRIQQTEQGKVFFKKRFDLNALSIDDAFVLVLTENEEVIHYGIEYLADFHKLYQKRNVYVLLDDERYTDAFLQAGGSVEICMKYEIQCLAAYFRVFHKKNALDTRIVFLTEKDGYGIAVEELLKKKAFSLEEYVAVSLYRLEG